MTTAKGGLAMATLKQAKKVLEIFEDTPTERMQAILASGLLPDIRDCSITGVDRELFRKSLRSKTLNEVLPPMKNEKETNASLQSPPSRFVGRYYMTVKLGTYPSTKAIRQAILASGKKIEKRAGRVLDEINLSNEKIERDLYEVTGPDLGFANASKQEIFENAFMLGFEKCPAEAGLLAYIKCNDKKERIVAMDTVEKFGWHSLFQFKRDFDVRSLEIIDEYTYGSWASYSTWLFIWPRK